MSEQAAADDVMRYYTLTDQFDQRVYAIIRKQGGSLERWSPTRREWKQAPWHWDQFYGLADPGELQEVTEEESAALLDSGVPANDISDADWDALSNGPDTD